MPTKNLIAQELKKIKEKYHLTNELWSQKSGVPVGTIARYLTSSLNLPNFPALGAMLRCVGESLDEFYDRITAKSDVPAEVLKLATVPVGVATDMSMDVPEVKAEIQERIILQAEEMQKLKTIEREKDMQIEMLEVRLEILERTLDAVKSLCSAR